MGYSVRATGRGEMYALLGAPGRGIYRGAAAVAVSQLGGREASW